MEFFTTQNGNAKQTIYLATEQMPGWALRPLTTDIAGAMAQNGFNVYVYDWTTSDDIHAMVDVAKGDKILYCGSIYHAEEMHKLYGIPRKNMCFIFHSISEVKDYDIQFSEGRKPDYDEIIDFFEKYGMNFKASKELINVCHEYNSVGCLNRYSEVILSEVKNKYYVPHYVDTDFFTPIQKEDSKNVIVGFAASFNWHRRRKGAKLLTEIVKKLDSMPGFEFDDRCVVSGDRKGLPYTKMPDYYRNIDVLISTSIEEGGPLSPLQAAACGVPSVTTDCGSMPELITDGVDGFLVPYGLPLEVKRDEFIKKLSLFKESPELLKKMKKAARDNVMDKWTIKNRLPYFLAFYFNSGITSIEPKTESQILKPIIIPQTDHYGPCSVGTVSPIQKVSPSIKVTLAPYEGTDNVISTSWWEEKKPDGISFLIRARNEESTIGMALDSLQQLTIPYEVNVFLNGCTDRTENEVMKRKNRGLPIQIFQYPGKMTRGGIEEYCTPIMSVHSSVWFWNWALTTSNFEYQCRWDADFIMTNVLSRELVDAIKQHGKVYKIKAVYADTLHANNEPYLFSKYAMPHFYKHTWWHATSFGPSIESNVQYAQLNGSLIHDSSLNIVKSMWNDPPWWDDANAGPVMPEMANDLRTMFNRFVAEFGSQCKFVRASDPAINDTFNRFVETYGNKYEPLEPVVNKIKFLLNK